MYANPTARPTHRSRDGARARAAACLLLSMLLCAAGPAYAEWFYDVDAGGLYDDNLTRAQQAADVRGDGAATLAAAAGWYHAPSGTDGITLSLEANSEAYARFHGLNLISIGGGAGYRHKSASAATWPGHRSPSAPATTPFAAISATAIAFEARLEAGKRLSENFDALGRRRDRPAICQQRPAGRAWISASPSIYAGTAYLRAPRTTFTERLQVGSAARRGDVVSTTRQNLDIFWRPTRLPPIRPSAATSTLTGCAARPPRPTRL
jgi:hypothetical protein